MSFDPHRLTLRLDSDGSVVTGHCACMKWAYSVGSLDAVCAAHETHVLKSRFTDDESGLDE